MTLASAATLTRAIRDQKVASAEVVAPHLARIAQVKGSQIFYGPRPVLSLLIPERRGMHLA